MTPSCEIIRIEARLLGAVLAYELSNDMIISGLKMLEPDSMMGRMASLSSNSQVFAFMWVALSVFVSPYWILQVTGFGHQYRALFTRMACWSILCSGVFWVYLAFIGKGLDYAYITYVFVLHGLTCIFMAAILAYSLNAAQRRAQDTKP